MAWKGWFMPEGKQRQIYDDYVHLEDMVMKTAAQFFGEEMLGFIGITKKVLRAAPTELIHLEARQMYEDFNYEMEDGSWYHFEFESDSIKAADLMRFREYEAITSRVFHVPITTFVICSSSVKELLSELNTGINTYKVKVIRLKDMDADHILYDLLRKPADEVQKKDLIPALLSPFMSGKTPQNERILKGLSFLRGNYGKIQESELDRMQAVLYALAIKFLNENELAVIKEEFAMTKLGQMLVEDGIEKGIEKGIKALVEACRELGASYDQTVEKVKRKFDLCDGTAAEAVRRYWK